MAHELGQSDWGDWLPRAIADASPDGVDVWYLGCNGFVLKGCDGTTVFVDPYLGTGDPPRTVRMIPVPFDPTDVADADAMFATHEHSDHVHGPTQAPILAGTGATYYAPDASLDAIHEAGWTAEWDVADEQFVEVEEGRVIDLGEFTVHVVEADDPDADHSVGYVIDHDAGTFFHAGDARPTMSFTELGRRFDIDVGVLAFGSVGNIPDTETGERTPTRWYNDENQLIEAANDLELDRLLPSHWDMWRSFDADPTALYHHAHGFDYPRRLEIVQIGDRISI